MKKWITLSLLVNLSLLYGVYVAFFSAYSVPARWKDASLLGKTPAQVHAYLGGPDVRETSVKFYDQWVMKDTPNWILNVRYGEDGKYAIGAYVFRVYFKDIYPKTGLITQIW